MDNQILKVRAGVLARHYIREGMSPALADAILACRWAEALLSKSPEIPTQGLIIYPAFNTPVEALRAEWHKVRRELHFDTLDALPVRWPNQDEDEAGDRYIPWPIEDQEKLLFGRWSYLFQ